MERVMLAQALLHTVHNRSETGKSDHCACFHCFSRFGYTDIRLWTDSDDPGDEDPGALRSDGSDFPGTTAVCPHCENCDVIGSASGYILTDDFLRELNFYWYGGRTAHGPVSSIASAPDRPLDGGLI